MPEVALAPRLLWLQSFGRHPEHQGIQSANPKYNQKIQK
jgi:hypothetical protein